MCCVVHLPSKPHCVPIEQWDVGGRNLHSSYSSLLPVPQFRKHPVNLVLIQGYKTAKGKVKRHCRRFYDNIWSTATWGVSRCVETASTSVVRNRAPPPVWPSCPALALSYLPSPRQGWVCYCQAKGIFISSSTLGEYIISALFLFILAFSLSSLGCHSEFHSPAISVSYPPTCTITQFCGWMLTTSWCS